MDGERYLVELEFKRVGDFGVERMSGSLKRAEKGFDAFKRGWTDFRSSISPVGEMFDGVVRSAVGLARVGAMVGAGALFAGAAYGVTNLNNELEKATIGLGVIFNASGVASSVPKGLERAQQVVAQMRTDAQKLPGEFNELQNIFTTAATPAFRSGASIDQLRELSAKAMVAGKVTNMDMGQVAREFTLLLEGRAGSHNTFGSKMGLTGAESKKFNALADDKRFEALSKLLSKYESGLTMFEASFDAQSSTLSDNVKGFVRTATGPLFESMKTAMAEANAWFSDNQQEIQGYATTIGYALRDAFVDGKKMLVEWGPILLNFAETAYARFHAIWYDAAPYIEDIGAALKSAFEDPNGTIDKMITLAELVIAMKGASMLGGVASGLGGAASGLGGMMSSAGLLGSGAAAGGGAAAAAGAGTLAVAGAGAALIAALGGVTAALYQFNELQHEREDEHRKNMRAKAEAGEREIMEMAARGASEMEIQSRMNEMHEKFMAMGQNLADEFLTVALAAQQASGALFGYSRADPGGRDSFWGDPSKDAPMKNVPFWMDVLHNTAATAVKEPDRAKAGAHKPHGGGGGIQKVEIVITQNQHPSRIARTVVAYLGKLQRNPGVSPHVTNYSALEDG